MRTLAHKCPTPSLRHERLCAQAMGGLQQVLDDPSQAGVALVHIRSNLAQLFMQLLAVGLGGDARAPSSGMPGG